MPVRHFQKVPFVFVVLSGQCRKDPERKPNMPIGAFSDYPY